MCCLRKAGTIVSTNNLESRLQYGSRTSCTFEAMIAPAVRLEALDAESQWIGIEERHLVAQHHFDYHMPLSTATTLTIIVSDSVDSCSSLFAVSCLRSKRERTLKSELELRCYS